MTYNVAGNVTKDLSTGVLASLAELDVATRTVKRMLMSKSQPQPVMKATAAGGKMIATFG